MKFGLKSESFDAKNNFSDKQWFTIEKFKISQKLKNLLFEKVLWVLTNGSAENVGDEWTLKLDIKWGEILKSQSKIWVILLH
jgi:hypothetical protein